MHLIPDRDAAAKTDADRAPHADSGCADLSYRDWLLLLLPALAGFLLSLHYGPMGFMPLDQSIVFDGGWRVLTGQVPIRDFGTPNGIPPILIQALFFRTMGVSWSAYVAHAALFNALFCATVYLFLRLVGGSRRAGVFYATLSGVVFYPTIGVPYLELHAFYFSFLTLTLATGAVRARSPGMRRFLWGVLPFAVLVAYLSKQIPTVYLVPMVPAWAFALDPRWPRKAVRPLIAGTAVALTLSLVCMAAFGVSAQRLQFFVSELPAAVGEERLRGLLDPAYLAARVQVVIYQWNLGSVFLVLLFFISLCAWGLEKRGVPRLVGFARTGMVVAGAVLLSAAVALPGLGGSARSVLAGAGILSMLFGILLPPSSDPAWRDPYGTSNHVVMAGALLLVCLLYTLTAIQHPANGISYVFISAGLLHVTIARSMPRGISTTQVWKGVDRATALLALLMVVAATDAVRFDRRINRSRVGVGIAEVGARPPRVPPSTNEFAFLGSGTPEPYGSLDEDLPRLVGFLRRNPGNFFLIGDASVLYGFTGRPSINPVLWFHPGLTTGEKGSAAYEGYRKELLLNLERFQVRYVIVEGEQTWKHERFETMGLPLSICGSTRLGVYRVIERCPPSQPPSVGASR